MTRRKTHLLDILRERNAQGEKRPETHTAPPAPVESPTEQAPSSERVPVSPAIARARSRPLLGLLRGWRGIGFASFLLAIWLGSRLDWGAGESPVPPTPTVHSPSVSEPTTPAPASFHAASEQPTSQVVPIYGVCVITYNLSERNTALAIAAVDALKMGGFDDVIALQRPPEDPAYIEIYVGKAAAASDLEPLAAELRRFRMPGGPAQPAFPSVRIGRIPQMMLR